MTETFIVSGAILIGAAVIAAPLNKISEHLQAIVKTFYNPDGTRR